jgi:hypothetical protein
LLCKCLQFYHKVIYRHIDKWSACNSVTLKLWWAFLISLCLPPHLFLHNPPLQNHRWFPRILVQIISTWLSLYTDTLIILSKGR